MVVVAVPEEVVDDDRARCRRRTKWSHRRRRPHRRPPQRARRPRPGGRCPLPGAACMRPPRRGWTRGSRGRGRQGEAEARGRRHGRPQPPPCAPSRPAGPARPVQRPRSGTPVRSGGPYRGAPGRDGRLGREPGRLPATGRILGMARHWSGLHTGIAIGGQVDLVSDTVSIPVRRPPGRGLETTARPGVPDQHHGGFRLGTAVRARPHASAREAPVAAVEERARLVGRALLSGGV